MLDKHFQSGSFIGIQYARDEGTRYRDADYRPAEPADRGSSGKAAQYSSNIAGFAKP